jgi:hypothetical protein
MRDISLLQGADIALAAAHSSLAQLAKRTADPLFSAELAFVKANIDGFDGVKKELARDCRNAADSYTRAAADINVAAVKGEREDSAALRKARFLEWAAINYRNSGNNPDAEDQLREAISIIEGHAPKFSDRKGSFEAVKERLQRELQGAAPPAQDLCN